jgi:hypothetical protein
LEQSNQRSAVSSEITLRTNGQNRKGKRSEFKASTSKEFLAEEIQ